MHKPTRTFHERTARDCYDWITPEDVIRVALGSFYALCRELDELPDDPTEEYAEFLNGRSSLAEDLSRVFLQRLNHIGYLAGAPGFYPDDGQMLARRFGPPSPDSPPKYQSENPAGRRLKPPSFSVVITNPGPSRDIHRAKLHQLLEPRRLQQYPATAKPYPDVKANTTKPMLTRPHNAVLVHLLLVLSAQTASAPLAPGPSASQAAAPASADGENSTTDALHSIPDTLGLGAVLPASTRDQTMRNDETLAPLGADAMRQVNAADGSVMINGAPDESWIRSTLGYVRDNALTTLIAMLTLFGLVWLFSAALHYVNTSVPRLYDVRQRRRRRRHSHDSSQEGSRSSAPEGTHHSSRRSSREREERQPEVKRDRRRRRHSRPQP